MQLDADDWIARTRVSDLITLARRTAADVVADDQLLVMDTTRDIIGSRFIENGYDPGGGAILTRGEFVRYDLGSVKPMIKAELIYRDNMQLYPTDIRYGEDFVFLFRLLSQGARMVVTGSPGYFLRRGDTGSLTRNREALFRELIRGTDILRAECRNVGDMVGEELLNSRLKRMHLLWDAERLLFTKRIDVSEGIFSGVRKLAAVVHKMLSAAHSRYRRLRYLKKKVAEASCNGL